MRPYRHLDEIFRTAERIPFDDASKFILMSDCHRGDGSQADEFFRNENLYLTAMNRYFEEGYTYIELGDGDELWENKKMSDIIQAHPDSFRVLKRFWRAKRLYFLYGNHDMVKKEPGYAEENLYHFRDSRAGKEQSLFENVRIREGLVLTYQGSGKKAAGSSILLIHGHQADILNNTFWKLARLLVRYFWKPLELFGISDPTSPAQNQEKKEKVSRRLARWAARENRMLIAGHTHRPMFPETEEPMYFNDGSCVHPLFITGIEIAGGKITLVKWSVKAGAEGILYVGRDILAGPVRLEDFFYAKKVMETCSYRDPSMEI